MNLKWIGAALIITGCGGVGFLFAYQYRREVKYLEQLVLALEYMECELEYRLTSLPELCRKVAERVSGGLRKVFEALDGEMENQVAPDVVSCMKAALSRVPELPGGTANALSVLGGGLGVFDLSGQLKSLRAVISQCSAQLQQLKGNQVQRLRSYQTLGLCAGAALAILFI